MADPSVNLEILVGRPRGGPVVRDYLDGADAALAFFGAHYASLEAFRAKAREVDGRFDRNARLRAVDALETPPGADPERLERFVDEGGYVVTTGQQPGLFGGPLYSVYKALTAVVLARRLEEALGKPVLPVFWVASEDHDWDEANHTWLVGVDNELHRLAVSDPDPSVHPALHRIALGDDARDVTEQFLAHLPRRTSRGRSSS